MPKLVDEKTPLKIAVLQWYAVLTVQLNLAASMANNTLPFFLSYGPLFSLWFYFSSVKVVVLITNFLFMRYCFPVFCALVTIIHYYYYYYYYYYFIIIITNDFTTCE